MKALHVMLSASLALTSAATLSSSAAAAAAKKAPAAAPAAASVDPPAVAALQRMSAYLRTLDAFEIKSEFSVELVMDDGQKTEVDGTTRYLVHKPDGFLIEVATDKKLRQFFYDGKTLTVSAPKLGVYAGVAAPPTIRQTLDLASEKYGINLPLVDLFRWSDPSQARADKLQSARVVGTATIGGVACDQYAFREGDVDWQIWIAQGDKPAPRKVVITDRVDPARPEFVARLDWNTAPEISKDAFVFTPAKDAMSIKMAAQ
jgi:hypothetical protein